MTYSHFDPAAQNRVPWNFRGKIGSKLQCNQKQFGTIRILLDRVELNIGGDISGPEIRTRATITQRKTGNPV